MSTERGVGRGLGTWAGSPCLVLLLLAGQAAGQTWKDLGPAPMDGK